MENENYVNQNYKKIIRADNRHQKKDYHRLPWLDVLRGLTVISMICYHWMWDVIYIQNETSYPWFDGIIGYIWQQSICWSFIIFSGFSLSLSRHPFRRGLIVFGTGAVVTIATVFILPRYFVSGIDVWFGVLTLIGSAMLITALLKPVFERIPAIVGLVISLGLFFVTKNINSGYLGFEGLNFLKLPEFLYANHVTAFFGFPPSGFYSVDYFSLFPWLFLFWAGFFIYRIYDYYRGEGTYKRKVPVLGDIGRNSLFIYVVHQPIIILVLFILYEYVL